VPIDTNSKANARRAPARLRFPKSRASDLEISKKPRKNVATKRMTSAVLAQMVLKQWNIFLIPFALASH
jgi:hypothetical protein